MCVARCNGREANEVSASYKWFQITGVDIILSSQDAYSLILIPHFPKLL